MTASIVGARTMEQFASHPAVVDWELESSQVKRLTGAARRRLPCPYGFQKGGGSDD
ncbi:hypothetical protein [Streptomyces sp. WMMB 322]|uniref:hypothetical protein n=1 Tax=Streptomyces sp. WMMB 322 TaxID=1286821 RepID=UPI000823B946|nr:hypothetical protein [Streptomyces sp. WMMB 322]SCK28447.1 hypothetical protein H180DRAFT_02224 [Streptomyces sp. WMMB 322]